MKGLESHHLNSSYLSQYRNNTWHVRGCDICVSQEGLVTLKTCKVVGAMWRFSESPIALGYQINIFYSIKHLRAEKTFFEPTESEKHRNSWALEHLPDLLLLSFPKDEQWSQWRCANSSAGDTKHVSFGSSLFNCGITRTWGIQHKNACHWAASLTVSKD